MPKLILAWLVRLLRLITISLTYFLSLLPSSHSRVRSRERGYLLFIFMVNLFSKNITARCCSSPYIRNALNEINIWIRLNTKLRLENIYKNNHKKALIKIFLFGRSIAVSTAVVTFSEIYDTHSWCVF